MSIREIVSGFFKRQIGVDVLPWLPCVVYYIWINYLLFQSVLLQNPDREFQANPIYILKAMLFLYVQFVVLFIAIVLLDGLLSTMARRTWRVTFVLVSQVLFASFYLDYNLYKLMSVHLSQGIRVLFLGGLSKAPLNWAHMGIGAETLRSYVGWAVVAAGSLLYSFLMARRAIRRVGRFQVGHLVMAAVYALLVGEILRCGDDSRWATIFTELTSAMPIHIGRPGQASGKALFVLGLVASTKENYVQTVVERVKTTSEPRPDVFIFVLEGVRGDFITREITPNLDRFSSECLRFPDALSSGNATHISWYSLLTANFGVHYGTEQRLSSHEGSVPIRLLRALGYKINVMCSSSMDYLSVDRIAFGEDLRLCDSMFNAREQGGPDPPTRDIQVNAKVLNALEEPPGNRLFLIFYESSHHDYDWPPDEPTPFTPYAKAWKYNDFSIGQEQLNLIVNRYRNALHFQDRLVGEVLSKLKSKGQYDNTIIVALADHGEEFLEHGKLLHASNLFRPQTHVPFFLRFPVGSRMPSTNGPLPTATLVDLFPTLLDYLGIQVSNSFDGESVFRKADDYVIMAAQNGLDDPFRFCIQSGNCKAFFEYKSGTRPTATQRSVYLKQVTDAKDVPQKIDFNSPEGRAIKAGFRALYPGADLDQ